jgi:hypothetical protein
MTKNHAQFEREVLTIVMQVLGSEAFAAPQVFHRIELEMQYPETEIVIEHSTKSNPAKRIQRYAIWGPLFADADDPESVAVRIATSATGG